MQLNSSGVEDLIDEVLGKITDKSVSVLILGNEISINIEGEQHNFKVLSAEKVISVPTPILKAGFY